MLFRPSRARSQGFRHPRLKPRAFTLYSPLRGQEAAGPVRGRTISAHGFSRGKKEQFREALERATQASRPNVSFVVFNLMSFQEGNKLLLV